MSFDGYGWWVSSTAALLYVSWIVHNLVAWFKVRPFLTFRASKIFIVTLGLSVPLVLFQIVNNFLFFANVSNIYIYSRPFEVLIRSVQIFPPLCSTRQLTHVQGSMVDLLLRSFLLYHQDALHPVASGNYYGPPPLRHHAVGNAVVRHIHPD